jgi:hypothetical protein
MTLIAEHLAQAKRDIAAGEHSLRSAAEHIAAAVAAGATQMRVASAVGKSQAWVNRMLKWRTGGFDEGGPFAADNSKAKIISRTNKSAKPDQLSRDRLVKILGMLGSNQDGEVLNAAHAAECLRRRLGMTWAQLIIKGIAKVERQRKAA